MAIAERELTTHRITQTLPTRPLGPLGWNASVITLGGVKWDTQCSDSEAVELIHKAMDLGINTFDTAHIYGDGESERKLGLAMRDRRDEFWVNTKVIDRTYDGAMKQMEISFSRLKMDHVDLMFVHSVDDEEQANQILGPNSVLKAVEEMRDAGRVRHIGVSGHWVKHVMARMITEYPFEAVLFPVGLFNLAHEYSFVDEVLPVARQRNMAVLGMKVFGAGRVKLAPSVRPYLQYSLNLPIDTAVIGCDSIAQLEEMTSIAREQPRPLSPAEINGMLPECLEMTESFDAGEFDWVRGYKI